MISVVGLRRVYMRRFQENICFLEWFEYRRLKEQVIPPVQIFYLPECRVSTFVPPLVPPTHINLSESGCQGPRLYGAGERARSFDPRPQALAPQFFNSPTSSGALFRFGKIIGKYSVGLKTMGARPLIPIV